MKKHRFNIFPEMKPEDYARLRDDIRDNGYDQRQPVIIYQGDIIDGWNRQKACDEIGISPTYRSFDGTDGDAIAYVMRTNKRRNLNSGQWATIAVERGTQHSSTFGEECFVPNPWREHRGWSFRKPAIASWHASIAESQTRISLAWAVWNERWVSHGWLAEHQNMKSAANSSQQIHRFAKVAEKELTV